MVLPERVRYGNPAQGTCGMAFSKAHRDDSNVRRGVADAKQDAFASRLRPSNVALAIDHCSVRERKHIYTCSLLFVISSVLALAQSGLGDSSPVPLIALESSPVSGAPLLEAEHRSARVGDTQFPVDKLTPGCQGVPFSTRSCAFAQQGPAPSTVSDYDIQSLRKDLRSAQKQLIAANMPLTDAEAQKFWPMYEQYDAEKVKINDDKLLVIKDYAVNFENLTDNQAQTW